jgi:hypothetical protein
VRKASVPAKPWTVFKVLLCLAPPHWGVSHKPLAGQYQRALLSSELDPSLSLAPDIMMLNYITSDFVLFKTKENILTTELGLFSTFPQTEGAGKVFVWFCFL